MNGDDAKSRRDPPKAIDMSVQNNVDRARELAEAASDADGWGEYATRDVAAIQRTTEKLWACWKDGGELAVAITGNGPTSQANAAFFVSARRIVLGLLEENDRLRRKA